MHKAMSHIEKAECLQDRILSCLENIDLNCDNGKETFYYMVDCSKDLAEIMEKEAKAVYYKKIAEGMKKAEEEEEQMLKMGIPKDDILRMGYDNWRYSSGRYAPTGKGHYVGHRTSGYTPAGMPIIGDLNDPYREAFRNAEVHDPFIKDMIPMGYTPDRDMSRTGKGDHYDKYLDSRRHYTETKKDEDKQHMYDDARHHVKDVEHTMKDMWKDADPALKRDMKSSLQSLLNEMTV